jgi:hypothetical protein
MHIRSNQQKKAVLYEKQYRLRPGHPRDSQALNSIYSLLILLSLAALLHSATLASVCFARHFILPGLFKNH